MHPVLLELGPIRLHSYGLMIALGFLLILWLMQRDASKLGINPDIISELAIGSLIIGVVSSRLLHIAMYSQNYSISDPVGLVAVWRGGLVFQGAIPTVILYLYWAFKKKNIDFWIMPEVVIPYVPLAQAFGRMGCFFNGCCHGRRADSLPWAVVFPIDSPAYRTHIAEYPQFIDVLTQSFPVHPTQIYSIIGLLIICALLLGLRKWWHPFAGFTLPLYLILYGVKRVNVEHFRGDDNPTGLGFGLLTDQQVYSLIMIMIGIILFVWLWRKNHTEASSGD